MKSWRRHNTTSGELASDFLQGLDQVDSIKSTTTLAATMAAAEARLMEANQQPEEPRQRTKISYSQQMRRLRQPQQQQVALVLSYSLVILLPLLVATTKASGQQQQQQPQYIRQRSPMYQQPQQLASQLVSSSNLQAAYQNDQPTQLARQPFQAALQADLDNVIESTTATNSHNHQPAFLQARPLFQQQHPSGQTCQLPVTWAGKWHQLNKETIRVTNSEISDKGLCRDRKGDKFLFESTTRASGSGGAGNGQQTPCFVCLVMNERHLNVLQYKESTCQQVPAQHLNRSSSSSLDFSDHSLLETICSDITGDAQLESMFRLDTPPTECPITGKFQFTYDSCREPVSSLDSCIDKKQLNFKYSACQDAGESKSEVLKCYADWSEGNNYYMIGRLEHASNQQDRGKFRCFLYEKSPDGDYIQMAQTLEESCYGLINPNEGPRTLRLSARQSGPSGQKCHFPAYIQGQSESWLSVDNSLIYMFNANSSKYQVKETREGQVIEEASCLEQVRHPHSSQHFHQARTSNQQAASSSSRRYPPSSNHFNQIDPSQHQTAGLSSSSAAATSSRQTLNDVVYLVQITKNCYTTDYCVRFYRRTSGIVQIDYFIALPGVDGQQRCRNAFIGTPQTQIITSTNLEQQRCPFDGAYTIEAPPESDFSYNPSNIFICPRQSYLTAQCDNPTRLRIHYKCSPAKYMIKNLYCLGSWTTGGLVRLLLADDERQRYSAWYRDYSTSAALTAPQSNLADDSGSSLGLTRSQQLLGLSPSSTPQPIAPSVAINSIASIVDLQIALLTALPTVTKPMQVRLTRRSQCSELRGYSNQGSLASSSSSAFSVPSYAAPSASSASSINSLFLSRQPNTSCQHHISLALVCALVLTLWQATTTLQQPPGGLTTRRQQLVQV